MIEQNINLMCDWMRSELVYSHTKVPGFDEKFRRLQIPQGDPQSVISFMGSYWNRFQIFSAAADQKYDSKLILMALQQLGKVPNGLCDKVALFNWMQSGDEFGSLGSALDLVKERLQTDRSDNLQEILSERDFNQTRMSSNIIWLNQTINTSTYSIELARDIALENTILAVKVWSEYIDRLRGQNKFFGLPKPGLPSGEIITSHI